MHGSSRDQLRFSLVHKRSAQFSSSVLLLALFFVVVFFALLCGGCAGAELHELILNETSFQSSFQSSDLESTQVAVNER